MIKKFSHWFSCFLGFHFPMPCTLEERFNESVSTIKLMPYHHCRYCGVVLWYNGPNHHASDSDEL